MGTEREKTIVGNWKMNGIISSLDQIKKLSQLISNKTCEVIICPPATLLSEAINITIDTKIKIGSQNCHEKNSGAFTGEISAQMLYDIGVKLVILGHSERRQNNLENNALVKKKAESAHQSNLKAIICIGETDTQKKNGQTVEVIKEQLSLSLPFTANSENTIIAYEPIWAIGSGKTPSTNEIKEVHKILRNHISEITTDSNQSKIKILYGGSVNSENCSEILRIENVDGALVGGASLTAESFSQIINFNC